MPKVTIAATEVLRRTVVHGVRYTVAGSGGYAVEAQDDGSVLVSRALPGTAAVARSTVDKAVPYTHLTTLVVAMSTSLIPGVTGYTMPGEMAAYVLTGEAAQLLAARMMAAGTGAITLTGNDARVFAQRLLAAGAGDVAVAGQAAGLRASRKVSAAATAYALTGSDATLRRLIALAAAQGSYALSGQAAALVVSRLLAGGLGTYALAGNDAGVRASRLVGAGAGAYALAGQSAGVRASRLLAGTAAAYVLAGQSAGVRASRKVAGGTGTYALAGVAAGIRASRKVIGTFGSFLLVGSAAALVKLEVESIALFAAMSVQPDSARKAIINTFIKALKDAGVWTKTDVQWVLAAHDEQAGRLNWKSPGSFTLTAVNSPTFTTDRGFAGNGTTSYLDTGWDPGTNGVQMTQNNTHISVYQRTSPGGNEVVSDNQGSFRHTINAGAGALTRGRINSGTEIQAPAGGTLPLQAIGRRNDGTNASLMRDGVQVLAPTAAASVALQTVDLVIGKRGGTFVTSQVSGVSVGAYLDDTESLAFYNAWHNFMVAVGADT